LLPRFDRQMRAQLFREIVLVLLSSTTVL
jgi:hypothetical protein